MVRGQWVAWQRDRLSHHPPSTHQWRFQRDLSHNKVASRFNMTVVLRHPLCCYKEPFIPMENPALSCHLTTCTRQQAQTTQTPLISACRMQGQHVTPRLLIWRIQSRQSLLTSYTQWISLIHLSWSARRLKLTNEPKAAARRLNLARSREWVRTDHRAMENTLPSAFTRTHGRTSLLIAPSRSSWALVVVISMAYMHRLRAVAAWSQHTTNIRVSPIT